mgnify:CR=1 FL=1
MAKIAEIFTNHPIILSITIASLIFLLAAVIFLAIKNAKMLKIGDFQIDFSKSESVKDDDNKNLAEAKRQVEERTRYIVSRQFSLVGPFLQSLRPIFNRLIYSILEDAMIDSLGVEREIRKVKGKENVSEMAGGDSYYLVEEVKTYKNNPKTRVFTNLVESAVESLLYDLQIELYQMLVSNNIGKCKEDVQRYVKDRITHIIGIIRNNLCDVYNQLSNENLFDTHQYWKEIGITYPEDWIQDQIVHLLVNCMKIRYSDFDV